MNQTLKYGIIGAVGFLIVTFLTGVTLNWDRLGTLFPFGEDPVEITRTYTTSTDRICKIIEGRKVCNLVIYSGVRNVYEDDVWKRRENARSFKDSSIKCVVKSDGINLAKCIDYNETSRTIEFSSKTGGFVPLRKYSLEYNSTSMENYKIYNEEFERNLDLTSSKKNLVLKANAGEVIKFGGHSTEIILNETNENLMDGYTINQSGHENREMGSSITLEIFGKSTRVQRVYIKWNISAIPSGQLIEKANMSFYCNDELVGNNTIEIYHVYDKAWSSMQDTDPNPAYYPNLTHNSQPCLPDWTNSTSCNVSVPQAGYNLTSGDVNRWYSWDVLHAVKRDYDASDTNVSFALRHEFENHPTSVNQVYLRSKEYAVDTSLRPYLNITYSALVVDTCTYSAGNWAVECSDNCSITSNVDVAGNNISINGTGYFVTTADISNYDRLLIKGESAAKKCRVYVKSGGSFK